MKQLFPGLGAMALIFSLYNCSKNNEPQQVPTPAPVAVNNHAAFTSINQYRTTIGSNDVYAYYFSKDVYSTLLNTPGATGIRIYNALQPHTGQKDVLMVAKDKDDNDLLAVSATGARADGDGDATPVAVDPAPCPAICGSNVSMLNL